MRPSGASAEASGNRGLLLYPTSSHNPLSATQTAMIAIYWAAMTAESKETPDIGWIEWLSDANRQLFLHELDEWKSTAELDELLRRDPDLAARFRIRPERDTRTGLWKDARR